MIKSGRFAIPGLWSSWLASSPSTSPFILPSHLGVNDRYFEIRGNDLLKESADPALAKAGAAPGTTAGVELFSFPMLCTFHEPPRP